MNMSRIVVLGTALVASIGAAFLVNNMFSLPAPVEASVEAAPVVKEVKVLVSARDMGQGVILKNSDMKWQPWPAHLVSSRFITEESSPQAIQDYVGAIVRSMTLEGEPILSQKVVVSKDSGFMSAILETGMRAFSIEIEPQTSAGGFILPNDRVDVMVTSRSQDSRGRDAISVDVALKNIRVLAIDQTVSEQGGSQSMIGRMATLEVSETQASILALSQAKGQVSLALRSLGDISERSAHENSSSINIVRFGQVSRINVMK